MSEGRKRDNGCSQRNINCGGGVDEIDVHSVTPSTISCDLIDGVPIHQLTKYCEEAGGDKKIYPISVIQAIFDARTGIRLDKVLSMCNAIYLEYEGDFEHTVSKVQGVQRRKGLIVTYRDITNTVSTIRYKSTDLSDEAWNNSDNWEGWSFDTASSDLLDMLNSIFSNIEDYPEIYDALKNQINLVVQDVFGNINNYPAVKKIITDSTKDNLDDVLADIFANLNSYPQIKSAFDNAFGRYINNVFGHVNNYPQVVNVIKTGVANVLDNIDQHPDLKAIIENAVNSRFYFLDLPAVNSQRYDPSKKFKNYTRLNISKTIYNELSAAIKAGKTIVLYTNHATKSSRVVTTRIEGEDIYLQYFIRVHETETIEPTDNKPDIRPEFWIINVIINGYNNSNQYIGEYIVVGYDFDNFVKYNSNKSNGVLALNTDGKIAYEQLYPEVIGYEKIFEDKYFGNIGPEEVVVEPNDYITIYHPCMQLDIASGIQYNEEKSNRVAKGNFAGKSYVDVYLFNGTTNIQVNLIGLKFIPGAQAVISDSARYRFEIFEGFVDVKKIDTEAVSNAIVVNANMSAGAQLPEHDDGTKFLNVTYKDINGITKTEEFDLTYYHDVDPQLHIDEEGYRGELHVYGNTLGQNGVNSLDVNTIFTDLPNLSVTVSKQNSVTFTKGSSTTPYYYSAVITLS